MMENKLLTLLSTGLYLTLNEIVKLLHKTSKEIEPQLMALVQDKQVYRRHFAGRDYFRIVQPQPVESQLGTLANQYLDHRPAARKLGAARTCYRHLAGKAGVMLFDQLIAQKMIAMTKPSTYRLTDKGRSALTEFLGHPVQQGNVQTCIDFSERRVHLAGKLGNDILTKLVADHKVALAEKRMVQILQPLSFQFKEAQYVN